MVFHRHRLWVNRRDLVSSVDCSHGLVQVSAPSVFPLVSCCSSATDELQGSVAFACLAAGYFPGQAEITWEPHDASRIKTFPEIIPAGGNTYIRSSQITVPSAEAETNTYTCIVKHPAIKKPEGERKRIESREINPQPLQVRVITPACDAQSTSLELVCVLSSAGPGRANVEWLVNGAVAQRTTVTLTRQQSNSYSSSIRSSITKKSWDKGDRYTCRATRLPGAQNVEMYNTSICEACSGSMQVPTISLTKPSFSDLVKGTAAITCLVEGSFLENIQITWNVNGSPSTGLQDPIVTTVTGGRKNAKSVHSVSLDQWKRGATFQCKVTATCFEKIAKDVTIRYGMDSQTTKPTIKMSKAYREVSSSSAVAQILVCDVSGFSPAEIIISWKKNSRPLSEALYVNGPVLPSGNVYTTYSMLRIGRNEVGDGRDSYTCEVHHPSSLDPVIKAETLDSACYKSAQVPTLSITKPSYRDLVEGTANITCLVEGSFLQNIQITWNVNGRPSTGTQAEVVKRDPSGLQDAKSSHSVSLEQWKKGTMFQCKVASACFEEITKDVTIKQGTHTQTTKPTIKMSKAYREVSSSSAMAQILVCDVSGFSPAEIIISWKKNSRPLSETLYVNGPVLPSGNVYTTYSMLRIGRNEVGDGRDSYTCEVHHPSSLDPIIKAETLDSACYKSAQVPTLSITKPSYRDLVEGTANITCLVEGSFLQNIQITWNVNGRPSTRTQPEVVTRDASGLQNAKSSHSVSLEQWKKGTMFQCKVASACFEEITKDITIKQGTYIQTTKPTIKMSKAYREVSSNSTIAQILVCDVSGFSPDEISISWKKNNLPLSKALYVNGPVLPSGNVYTTYSTLRIGRNEVGDGRDSYTCVVHHPSSLDPVIQAETLDSACYKSAQVPTLSITKPSYRDLVEGTANITCLVEGSFLQNIQITWNVNGRPSTGTQEEVVTRDPSGLQNAKSSHSVSLEQWKKGTMFQCKVASACFEEITKDVTMKQDTHIQTTKPLIRISQAHGEVSSNSTIAQILVCDVSGFSPDEISISWKKNSLPLSKALYVNGPVLPSGNAYTTYSILKTGRNEVGDGRDSYTCVVYHHSSLEPMTESETLSSAADCSGMPVKVEAIPPSFADIYLTKSAKLTCRISNIPRDQDLAKLSVTWTRESDNTRLETQIGEVEGQGNSDLVFVDATAAVGPEEWERNDTFECKVHLPLLPTAEIKTLRRLNGGIPHAPAVYVLPPSSEELSLQEMVTITCLLKGFYPNDFFVKWLRNDEPMGASEYFISQPIQESKTPERYFTYSTLNVKKQDWSYGATYTCVVGHEALPLQTTQKTIDKNTDSWDCTVAAGTDLCVIYNETEDVFWELTQMDGAWNRVPTYLILFLLSLFYAGLVTFFKVKCPSPSIEKKGSPLSSPL